ncbi:sulfite exporter TauE/SafE family protein [Cobetia amphilecti]|nr:sulfite exporter TauE/SafE family protein [Cobetia amphilecti]
MPVTDSLDALLTLPDYSALAWSAIIFSTYLTGISKGGFAGGFGSLSVPLMALAIGPLEAAGILLPLLLVMDFLSSRAWWGKQLWSEVRIILPSAAIGIAVGVVLFDELNENMIRGLLGVISLLFAAYMLFKPTARKPLPRWLAIPAGATAGFTSFFAHAGAPPYNLYMIPRQHPKETFIATTVIIFAGMNLMKLGPYVALGEINLTSLSTSLLLVPVAWAGVRSGLWLQSRVNEKLFFRLIIIAMALVGVQLIYKAWG